MKFLYIFLFIFFYKLISNIINFFKALSYKDEYIRFLENKRNHISRYKQQTIKLFKKAGITDISTPITEWTGYGHYATIEASVFTNFPSNKNIIVYPALDMFENAIGIYRSRIIESFNPIYWIETILFLPQNSLIYIGLDSDKSSYKLLNVLITSIWWFFGIVFTFYRSNILDFVIEFLGKLK